MSKRFRRNLSLLLAAPLLLLVFGGILLAGFRERTKSDAERELATAKAAGLPIDISEVRQPKPSPPQDARPLYLRALKATDPAKLAATEKSYARGATMADIRRGYAALSALEPALKLIEQGSLRPRFSTDRDYRLHPLDYSDEDLRFLRRSAMALALRARAEGDLRDMEAMLADIRTIYRLAGHVGQGPTYFDKLAAAGIERVALRSLRRALHIGLDPREVERLATTGAKLPDWRESFRTEFVLGLYDLQWNQSPGEDARLSRILLQGVGMTDRMIATYVRLHRKAWDRLPKDLADYEGISAAYTEWAKELPKGKGPIAAMERDIAGPSLRFPSFWRRYLADRRLVADAARIWQGKRPQETDPWTGKPFQKKGDELMSPGPTADVNDDQYAPLPESARRSPRPRSPQ